MNDLLSKITTIPKNSLDRLDEKRCYIICDELHTAIQNCHDRVMVNIGIGKLVISYNEDEVSYKFIPSTPLEDAIKSVVLDNHNPIEKELEEAVVKRLISTYKDLF